MYQQSAPGVRFEWLNPPAVLAEGRTDVAGFVGIAARGPLHRPVKVESWTQYTSTFGAHIPQGYLAYAVEGFFANGGRTCWVVRVADPATAAEARVDLLDGDGLPALRLTAVTMGTWAREVAVSVSRTAADRFGLTLELGAEALELWRNLTMDPDDPRYAPRLLNDELAGSRLVRAEDLAAAARFPASTPSERAPNLRRGGVRLQGGADGLAALAPGHLSGEGSPERCPWGLAALALVDEVSIVTLPDLMTKPVVEPRRRRRPPRCDIDAEPTLPPPPETPPEFPPPFTEAQLNQLQNALLRHCELLQDRVAVLDPRIEDTSVTRVAELRQDLGSSYGALYWPWLRCPDPLGVEGLLRPVPPSGHVAGIYARGDLRVGVHKPPANELVEGASDVVVASDDITHADLNRQDVNVIRVWNGLGIRVAGARTLATDPPLPAARYVNVRRLLTMIEERVLEDTQWAVFEPNDPSLWREVDRVIRGFLDRLWRRGMLDGATAADAYSVTCDASTNPPETTGVGRLVCHIGLQPPLPAEYVIVRIGRSEGTTQITETTGGRRA
jgi:uncharacterized protein